MSIKPEETPPFAYEIRDPQWNVTYFVFAYESINTKAEVWSHVARFLGARKRRMPVNWQNLPEQVKLLLTQDGKIRAIDLPTQQQLSDSQKVQIQKKKRIAKWMKNRKKSQ